MQTRRLLLHSWTAQLQSLLPGMRVTQVRVLALMSLGLLWAESVSLPRIAAVLPLHVLELSTVRRLRRWLANARVPVVSTWQPLLGALVARLGQREIRLVFDPTPYRDARTLLILGLVVRGRALPLAWHIVPQQTRWRHDTWAYLERLCRRVAAALPPTVTVTLLVDRGLASAALLDLGERLGWHVVMRLTATPTTSPTVRLADGTTSALWDLIGGPGTRWDGEVAIFQAAGWRTAQLTIRWPRRYAAPWVLLSDRPAGIARVTEYRARMQCEAFYADCKTRGWNLERSHLTERNRLNRLLLALVLAAWWLALQGQQVIRTGHRRRFDRPDRRDLSLIRLGRRWIQALLDAQRLPALPFRWHNGAWSCRWAF